MQGSQAALCETDVEAVGLIPLGLEGRKAFMLSAKKTMCVIF